MIDPNLITTISTGELPPLPITLDSLLAHEITGDLHRSTVNELLQLLRPLVGKLQFEIVEMDVNNQYVIDNFDETGLGKNLCLGFAICNGNNGTKNRDGRSSIGYGTGFSSMGVFGGNKDATLVAHSHSVSIKRNMNSGGTAGLFDQATGGTNETYSTTTEGVSGTDKNYHPYIVTLVMMKL